MYVKYLAICDLFRGTPLLMIAGLITMVYIWVVDKIFTQKVSMVDSVSIISRPIYYTNSKS